MLRTLRAPALTLALLASAPSMAPASDFPADAPGWDLSGDAKVAVVDGRNAIEMRSGFAFRRDALLMDGTIEFDARFTGEVSYAYLHFRIESDPENEELYFLPHKSGLPDAIQYAPEFQHRGQFQLFHDASCT